MEPAHAAACTRDAGAGTSSAPGPAEAGPGCRVARWLLVLLALGSPVGAATTTEVLIDFPGSRTPACAAEPGIGRLRVTMAPDAAGAFRYTTEGCRDGAWSALESNEAAAIIRDAAATGFDEVSVRVPRGFLDLGPALTVQVRTRSTGGAIVDALGPDAGQALSLAGNPLGVPVSQSALVLLGGLLLIAGALYRHVGVHGSRRRGSLLLPVVALGLVAGPGTLPSGHADLRIQPAHLDIEDPGYDGTNASAAHDLRSVSAELQDRALWLRVRFSNLDGGLLMDDDRMLFIGNSLTAGNDLPGMVARIAAQAGKRLQVKSVLQGGAGLEDHFRNGQALREISAGDYPLVSLQQGPSSLPESQVNLRHWAVQFNAPIRANGGRPLLYMVWPDRSRLAFLDDVRDSYRNAALATDGAFAPAGIAWRNAWAADPALALYDSDDFHPSLLGSHLAALTLFCTIYRQSPEGLPAWIESANGTRTPLPPARARLLQRAAWDACRQAWRE